MIIYCVIYLMIPIYNTLIKNKKQLLHFLMFQLFLILAFRSEGLGDDLGVYAYGYDYISQLSFSDMLSRLHFLKLASLEYPIAFESGYTVISWVISHLGISFHGFLVLHAGFCCYSFTRYIEKYSEVPWLSVCMFMSMQYYEYSFGLLRQTLALAILLFALTKIEERNFKVFIILCAAAFTIHRVSLIYVALYFVVNINLSKKSIIIITFSYIIAFFAMPFLYRYVIVRVLYIFGKTTYITDLNLQYSNLLTLFLLIVIMVAIFSNNKFLYGGLDCDSVDKRNLILYWSVIISVPIMILGCYLSIFSRASELFSIGAICLVPNVMKSYRLRKITQIISAVIYVLLFGFMLYQFSDSMIVPYIGYWEEGKF